MGQNNSPDKPVGMSQDGRLVCRPNPTAKTITKNPFNEQQQRLQAFLMKRHITVDSTLMLGNVASTLVNECPATLTTEVLAGQHVQTFQDKEGSQRYTLSHKKDFSLSLYSRIRALRPLSEQTLQNLDYEAFPGQVEDLIQKENQGSQKAARSENPKHPLFRAYKAEPNKKINSQFMAGIEQFSSGLLPGQLGGYAEAQGRRPDMEDHHLACRFSFQSQGKGVPVALAAVFDGHNGDQVARLATKNLQSALTERLEEFNQGALSKEGVFHALQAAVTDLDRQVTTVGGATLCATLVIGGHLWTVNLGDSRAFLSRNKEGEACLQLSNDHNGERHFRACVADYGDGKFIAKPQDLLPSAKQLLEYGVGFEIYNQGVGAGKIGFTQGNTRIKGGETGHLKGHPFTHSLGDLPTGDTISRPTITCHPVTPDMEYLVIACDGAFEHATTLQTHQLLTQLKKNNPAISCEEMAQKVLAHAYEAESKDNISVLVVPMFSDVSNDNQTQEESTRL